MIFTSRYRYLLFFVFLFCIVFLFSLSRNPASASSQNLYQQAQEQGSIPVIVTLKKQVSTPQGLLRAAEVQSSLSNDIEALGATGIQSYELFPLVSFRATPEVIDSLSRDPRVESIQENKINFPSLASALPVINGDDLHTASVDGTGYAVAILDSGLDTDHEFFNSVVSEACYSNAASGGSGTTLCPNSMSSQTGTGAVVNCTSSISECDHGTHVAGIAAGNNGDGATLDGIANGADLISIQVFTRFDDEGVCGIGNSPCIAAYDSDIVLGLQRVLALHNDSGFTTPIGAVNMSLGSDTVTYSSESSCDTANSALKTAIDNLRSAGIPSFISAGNGSSKTAINTPSCISTAFAVSATTDADAVASYSNVAPIAEYFAPGSTIRSSELADTYGEKSGTSMAAPFAAGLFTALKASHSSKTLSEITTAMTNTGTSVTDSRSGAPGTTTLPRIDGLASHNALSGTSPTVAITSPTLVSQSTINDTTVRVTDDINILASDVSVAGSSTAGTSNFSCSQTTATQVDCTVDITSSGTFTISASDTGLLTDSDGPVTYTVDSGTPTLQTATSTTGTIVLTYSETLDNTSVPATTDFTVDIDSSPENPTMVAISGTTVTLTLSTTLDGTEVVEVSYTAGVNPIRDVAENNAANLTDQSVNNLADTDAPTLQSFTSATSNNTYGPSSSITITANYDENLDASSTMTVVLDTGTSVILNSVSGTALSGTYTVGATGSGETSSDLSVSSITSQSAIDLSVQSNTQTSTTLPGTNIDDGSALVIDTTAPVLSPVTLTSNGSVTGFTESTDVVTLSFTTNETLSSTPTVVLAGSSPTVNTGGAPVYTATYTVQNDDTGDVSFTISGISDQYGNTASNVTSTTNSSAIGMYDVAGIDTGGVAQIFTSAESSLLLGSSLASFVATLSTFSTEDTTFSGPSLLSSLDSSTIIGVVKNTGALSSATPQPVVFLPKSRTDGDTIKKYSLILPSGVTPSSSTTLGPVARATAPSISGQTTIDRINVPSSPSVTFSGGTIELCLAGTLATYDVSSVSDLNIYTSSDGSTWSVDASASNLTFTDEGQFCFQTNHLSDFVVSKIAASSGGSSGGGGGGGGGGGSSSRPELRSSERGDTLLAFTFSKGLLPSAIPSVSDFEITANGSAVLLRKVYVIGDTVYVRTISPLSRLASVTASYAKGSIDLQSTSGRSARDFEDEDISYTGLSISDSSLEQQSTSQPTLFFPTSSGSSDIDSIISILTLIASQQQSSCSALRVGSVGPTVRSLQSALASQGYSVAADGSYGPGTASVVRTYQLASGLTADGVAGSGTLSSLGVSCSGGGELASKLYQIIAILQELR